ncbi:MAG: hypothetical protein U9O18_11490, partial [Chloroflexota bacterium]|nr:hypothetical protein [Chloroflexota bacterium]
MSPVTRRTFAFGAAMMLAASAFVVAPVAAQDEPPTGGTAVAGEWQAATQLNPYIPNAVKDYEAIAPILRALVTVNSDGQWEPEFLTSLPSLEAGTLVEDEDGDGFTVTLEMMPDLVWSDGEPFTLHDLEWNLDWALKTAQAGVGCATCTVFNPLMDTSLEGDAYWAPENQYIESIEVSEDGLTADMKFAKHYAGWLGILSQQLIAPQFWENIADEDINGTAVPGADSLLEMPV